MRNPGCYYSEKEQWDLSAGPRPHPICILILRLWPKHTVAACLDSRLRRQETMQRWNMTTQYKLCQCPAAIFRITDVTKYHTGPLAGYFHYENRIPRCPPGSRNRRQGSQMTNSWLTQVEELRLGQSEDWVSARRLSPAASRARGGGGVTSACGETRDTGRGTGHHGRLNQKQRRDNRQRCDGCFAISSLCLSFCLVVRPAEPV